MSKTFYFIHDESESKFKAYDLSDKQIEKYLQEPCCDLVSKEAYDSRVDYIEWCIDDRIFYNFLEDKTAWDMFLIGAAGTGKTTKLRDYVQYCIDNEIPYVVCAFTHKACNVLSGKLPLGARVQTLHSFLCKRPGVNTNATSMKHINVTSQHSTPDPEPQIMFLDEFSMVGEKDELDIRLLQDPNYSGIPDMKVVWVGDLNQLGPVGDKQTVTPSGDYIEELTKIWRNDNPLQEPLNALISYIAGEQPAPLKANSHFIRGKDIIAEFKACEEDKVLLAYTNQRVEYLNREIKGRPEPQEGDVLFCPSDRQQYIFKRYVDLPERIERIHGDPLELNSKYRTLEGLHAMEDIDYAELLTEDGETVVMACIFGHYQYKKVSDALKKTAAESNQIIERKNPGYKAAAWSKFNSKHVDARQRSKAWREFLSFDECVVCLDFPFAMTVHKSQGSTYNTVFLDMEDLGNCTNFDSYLKLAYVGISRASHKVITN